MTETEPDYALVTFRAACLAASRDHGTATGPGSAGNLDFTASRFLCGGVELLTALQCDDADALAQELGWQSAQDLMTFLADGPDAAELPH